MSRCSVPLSCTPASPWLNATDLQLGSLGLSGEGWFDGYRLLSALTAKAWHLGAHMVRGEVVAHAS
jgi:hypothetical protein